jgi:hypothetical protein
MNSEFALLQHARRLGLDLWIHPETRSVLLDGLSYPSAKHALDYIYRMDLVQPEPEELLPPLDPPGSFFLFGYHDMLPGDGTAIIFWPIPSRPARAFIHTKAGCSEVEILDFPRSFLNLVDNGTYRASYQRGQLVFEF